MSSYSFYPGNYNLTEDYEVIEAFFNNSESSETSHFDSSSSPDFQLENIELLNHHSTNTKKPEPTINFKRPFDIIHKLVTTADTEKIQKGSKKIKRREAPKESPNLKQNYKLKTKLNDLESLLNDPNMDEKTKKKVDLMMRNRISAQLSRDRKKQYIQELEAQNQQLANQNHQLLTELRLMKENRTQLETEKTHIQKEISLMSATCPCSLLKTEGNSPEEMTDDDFPVKDMDNMSLTRIWQKKTSLGCLGYSFVLLTMLTFAFFFHNHEGMNKFKTLDGVQFMNQYQMDIEKAPSASKEIKINDTHNKNEREEAPISTKATKNLQLIEKIEESFNSNSTSISNDAVSNNIEMQVSAQASDYGVKHEAVDVEYQVVRDN